MQENHPDDLMQQRDDKQSAGRMFRWQFPIHLDIDINKTRNVTWLANRPTNLSRLIK